MSPAKNLLQVRINVLVDGKELIMPAPGLKDGFFLLKPHTVPFPRLAFSVVYKGLAQFGRRLQQHDLAALHVDLFIASALGVGPEGYFLDDGKGYFDLAYAIMHSVGGLAAEHRVMVVAENDLGENSFEPDPWDVQADMILTGEEVILTDRSYRSTKQGEIFWDQLALKRLKKITPLWKLHNKLTAGKSSM